MSVEEAREFFDAVPVITRKLQTLMDVGLSYIKLGQNATTLSGGEAQRVKLSRELSKRDTGKTLYILDEPTTGLHFHDIKQLLHVLHRLRDHGNTIIVIEHNLDVIKTADWIIDLGPAGGDGGGEVITTEHGFAADGVYAPLAVGADDLQLQIVELFGAFELLDVCQADFLVRADGLQPLRMRETEQVLR